MMRHRGVLIFVAVLYAVTWICGWRSHEREIAAGARHRYDSAISMNAKLAQHPSEMGHSIKLRTRGPSSGVEWCIPIVPSLCLANSYYVVGPLYAAGTTKLVLFYGVGSITVCNLGGWYA